MHHSNREQKDYHKILKVPPNATPPEIKKAYRKLSMKHHPDRVGGNAQTFRDINEAYEVLSSNPPPNSSRETTLEGGSNIFKDIMRNTFQSEMKKEPLFNMFFNDREAKNENNSKIGISDILNMLQKLPPPNFDKNVGTSAMFGFQPFGFNHTQSGGELCELFNPKPKPIIIDLKISLKDAFDGTTKPIEIVRNIVENNQKREETEKIYIRINEGIDDNEIIRLEKKGHRVNNKSGDLEILIKIIHDQRFERNGLDLICRKKLTFEESIVGFNFKIKHLNGKEYEINNADGDIIMNQQRVVQENLGFKRGDDYGNMIIVFEVETPELTRRQKELLRAAFL